MTHRQTAQTLALGVAVTILGAGACLLPYEFPHDRFVAGASFELGFNNSVAYLWFLGFLPVPAWIAFRLVRGASSVSVPTRFGPLSVQGLTRVLGALALAHAALFSAVYLYKGRFVFAEALYFQTLVYRMLQGDVPYVSFSFYYGPSMLYPAYWLARGVGVDAGYAIWFVATYLVGLVLLGMVLRSMLPSASSAATWTVFLAVGLINPWAGLNVTFLRFVLPSAAFFLMARFVYEGGRARFIAALAALTFAVTYSFEVAALSLAALGLIVALTAAAAGGDEAWRKLLRGPSCAAAILPPPATALARGAWLAATTGVLSIAVFYAIDPSGRVLLHYPEIALSYSSGAHNLPVYPNLPFLAILGLTVFAVAGATVVIRRGDAGAATPLILGYLLMALVTQRGAFGVSEPTHYASFGLPTLLLALFATGRLTAGRRIRVMLAAVVTVGFVLPLQYYHATLLAPFVGWPRPVVTADAAGETPRAAARMEPLLREAVKAVGAGHPYLMYDLDYYSFPVYREFGLRYPSYYTMLINARTPEGIRRVIDEVRSARATVLIRRADLAGVQTPAVTGGVRRVVNALSAAHTSGSELAALLLINKARLTAPFLQFLNVEYRPLWERDGLVALGPRDGG